MTLGSVMVNPCMKIMLPEPLFHNLSLVNPDIVILECAHAIREVKKKKKSLLMKKPDHAVSWAPFFFLLNIAEPKPD